MQRRVFLTTLLSLFLSLPAEAQADREAIIIDAAEMAPAVRSETPAAGKWWLNRDAKDWGAPNGVILMTGKPSGKPGRYGHEKVTPADQFVPYRIPSFTINPQARGWYRIYVGLYHEQRIKDLTQGDGGDSPRLFAKISNQPYPEYLQAPQEATGRVDEVYWKAADLTGRTIHIEQVPAPMPHPNHGVMGGITHVKLVPMSAEEVAAATTEVELPPRNQRLFGILDYTDEVFWWGRVDTEDDLRAIVYRHHQAGFGRIYWRCFGTHLDNSLDVPEAAARWSVADEKRWTQMENCQVGWMSYINLAKRFDPFKVALAYGNELGCEVHGWVRFANFNREPYANFWHEHPEFLAQMPATTRDPQTGEQALVKPIKLAPNTRVLSLAYPEVRKFYLTFFKQIASTGTRGIMIDLLRHPPIAGCEPIVAESFKQKYGMDIYERSFTSDPLVNEHLSQYLELFLTELRKEIGSDIEITVRCSGPNNFALRGKEWIAAGLIDTIVDGNWRSGNGPRATIDATVAAVGSRGKAFAVAEAFNADPHDNWKVRAGYFSADAIGAMAKHYGDRSVDRFGLYESSIFTWCPHIRRAIRAAGWNYNPDVDGVRHQ